MSTGAAPQRMLAFDNNPPLSLPMRYFLSAPLFAALAAGLLMWQGEAALLSRWSPLTLALTHLMVLGCVSMAMIGALLQMLPVVAGIAVPRVGTVGAVVHLGLTAGTLLLATAFWLQRPALFGVAMALLLSALALFVAACTVGLWRQHLGGAGDVVAAIRQSLASLLVTLILGALLGSAFAWPALVSLPLERLTDLHAMWGLLGWVGLLVIGVAFQVVPMFMITEPYPALLRREFTAALLVLLTAASLSSGLAGHGLLFHQACVGLLATGYTVFAAVTLYLLARRKRPKADTTTLYWRTAMACVPAATLVWLLSGHLPGNAVPLALGVLLIPGFALSAVNGMLYKIAPFLTWYHLQHGTMERPRKLPNVNHIIPEWRTRLQYALHCGALLLLLAACFSPARLAAPAAGLMCAACVGMCLNLATAARLYRQLRCPPRTPTAPIPL